MKPVAIDSINVLPSPSQESLSNLHYIDAREGILNAALHLQHTPNDHDQDEHSQSRIQLARELQNVRRLTRAPDHIHRLTAEDGGVSAPKMGPLMTMLWSALA